MAMRPAAASPASKRAPSRPGVRPKRTTLYSRSTRFVGRIAHGMWVHSALDSAASMAFNFFLSLIPLMVLVGFVLGHLVRTNGVDAFMGPLLDTIPEASADLIRHELQRLAGASSGSVAPLGVVTFFWLASSGVSHMMSVFEKVMHAPPRPWWKQRTLAIVYVMMGIAVASTTSWAIFEADGLLHENAPRMPQLSVTWNGVTNSHVARGPYVRETHATARTEKKHPPPAIRPGKASPRWPWPSPLASRGWLSSTGTRSSTHAVSSVVPGRGRSPRSPPGSPCPGFSANTSSLLENTQSITGASPRWPSFSCGCT